VLFGPVAYLKLRECTKRKPESNPTVTSFIEIHVLAKIQAYATLANDRGEAHAEGMVGQEHIEERRSRMQINTANLGQEALVSCFVGDKEDVFYE
jgi:hypothetical protein